jgi:hypothetical protein
MLFATFGAFNCLGLEAQDQHSNGETKTKTEAVTLKTKTKTKAVTFKDQDQDTGITVSRLPRDEALSRDFPSLVIGTILKERRK